MNLKLCLCLLCFLPLQALAAKCEAVYQAHLKSDMTLSYEQFDQTPGAGFRSLGSLGCYPQEAELIKHYLEATHDRHRSLRWHLAQVLAFEDKNEAAIRYARGVLYTQEEAKRDRLRWNAFVLATIAFLQNDKPALVKYRNEVAAGKSYYPNAKNLKVLDSLMRNFGKGYDFAYHHIEQGHPSGSR